MKRSTTILILLAILAVIALCVINIFISLQVPNSPKIHKAIDSKVSRGIEEKLNSLPKPKDGADGINGSDGRDGVTTTIEKQVVIQQPARAPKDGVDGKPGRDGANGIDGRDGRTPIIQVDEETGDILMRYDTDTLWSVLVEGCKLRKDCEQ